MVILNIRFVRVGWLSGALVSADISLARGTLNEVMKHSNDDNLTTTLRDWVVHAKQSHTNSRPF